MGKFITGKVLEDKITDIIHEAEKVLLIVSPYIKLDGYFKKCFSRHLKNPELHIILIFGKNETSPKKSLSFEDFDFFKSFPNVSIIYVNNLHAKYYGNEKKGVTTSINLYDYSFKNNVEFGIYKENSFSDNFRGNFDADVFNFSISLTKEYPAIFIKRPIFSKSFMGLKTNYNGSDILLDQSEEFIKNRVNISPRLDDYPYKLNPEESVSKNKISREEFENTSNNLKEIFKKEEKSNYLPPVQQIKNPYPSNSSKEEIHFGYCIRTGMKIDFNPEKPLSRQAYQTWSKFGDPHYSEAYCHFTGEPSFGETSVARPIMQKNWKKATSYFN